MEPEMICPRAGCDNKEKFTLYCSGTFWVHKDLNGTDSIEVKNTDDTMSVTCAECNYEGTVTEFTNFV